ncbi:ORF37 [callitrichine gammaherpesvirus 3]|uniref:ORF37 n=1 Tax=callitrichine gammaherpesvirus 3 TaxID=106331 RepID=Q993H3_9GAMA|nr:ORF37 [callitrichine gammaherpesvirus 3]AAK38245.1 ORF37 [callitrichine gammaherpesvirus 3]
MEYQEGLDAWLEANVWSRRRPHAIHGEHLLLPDPWLDFLSLTPILRRKLQAVINSVRRLRQQVTIYPDEDMCMSWARFCDPYEVRVIILGQDPYHGGQANGLAFSVAYGFPIPPSLRNVYAELERSIPEFKAPDHGCLEAWASQGVLLLNTVLTVEKSKPGSHSDIGWTWFTDHVITLLSNNLKACVFMLWGSRAGDKASIIDTRKHLVLSSQHPSPLAQNSTRRGTQQKFIGNNHFVEANTFLRQKGLGEIDWRL